MLKGKIITQIESLNGFYTKSEEKIRCYLLKKLFNVINLSVTDLAEEIGVGETTIVRFCKKLGYKGYHDFKLAIAQDSTLTVQQKTHKDKISEEVYQTILTVLEGTRHLIKQDLIDETVRLINGAKHVYFIGVGGSGVTANEAYSKFFRVSPKFHVFTDSHFQKMATQVMTSEDLVIVFSRSGSTKEVVDTVRETKKNNAKVIAVTNFNRSPITVWSDIVLLTSYRSEDLGDGTFVEKISQLYILDVILLEYLKSNPVFEEQWNRTNLSLSSKRY